MENIIKEKKFKLYNRFNYIENGKKYYFKKFGVSDRNLTYLYNELVAYKLAIKSGINCVNPTILSKKDIIGIVTESFGLEGYEKINGTTLLKKYYEYLKETNQIKEVIDEEAVLLKLNNLEDIWNALDYHFKDYENEQKTQIVGNIMKDLTKIFSFDIIAMQIDRHEENWEILEAKDHSGAH